jgi:hypothetical protein
MLRVGLRKKHERHSNHPVGALLHRRRAVGPQSSGLSLGSGFQEFHASRKRRTRNVSSRPVGFFAGLEANVKTGRLSEINSVAGPALLGLLGAYVTLWPPETPEIKFVVFLAFIVVGAITVVSALRFGRDSRQEIGALISGGSFCFFRIDPLRAKGLVGPFQLMMEAVGGPVFDVNYWICPASAKRDGKDPAYFSLDFRKPLRHIIHHGARTWDRELPLGEYFIEFDARNGYWKQNLKILVENGALQ